MRRQCLIGKIKEICSVSDKYVAKRINEENLKILRNHIPLFYILPNDGTALLFNEISNIWEISKSSLSDIINKYETQGLIKKCICSQDKRSIYISLTSEGLLVKEKLNIIEDEFLDLLLNEFDNTEKDIFESNIDKAINNVRKIP